MSLEDVKHLMRPGTTQSANSLLAGAVVYLDTSSLLALLENPGMADQVFEALDGLGDRLNIPSHVVIEYLKRVDGVQLREADKMAQTGDKLMPAIANASETLSAAGLPEELSRSVHAANAAAISLANDSASTRNDLQMHMRSKTESIRLRLDALVTRCALDQPGRDLRVRRVKAAEQRMNAGLPPGLDDIGKDECFWVDDVFVAGFLGDAIIWTEVLEDVAAKRPQTVLFVTEDGTTANPKAGYYQGKTSTANLALSSELADLGVSEFHVCKLAAILEADTDRHAPVSEDGRDQNGLETEIADALNAEIDRIYNMPNPRHIVTRRNEQLMRDFNAAAEPFLAEVAHSSVSYASGYGLPETVERLAGLREAEGIERAGGIYFVRVGNETPALRIVCLLSARRTDDGMELIGIGELWVRGSEYVSIPNSEVFWSERAAVGAEWELQYKDWCRDVLSRGRALALERLRELPPQTRD